MEDEETGDHAGERALTGSAPPLPARRPHLLLASGTLLDGRFLVDRDLAPPGAVGVTYVARDQAVDETVAVQEYLPRSLVERAADGATVRAVSDADAEVFAAGLALFLEEGRRLAAVDHPNVARVRACFEQNGTAYLVVDDGGAESLWEHALRRGLPLGEGNALSLLRPVLEGLEVAHDQGLLHRDVTPETIRLRADGRPLLVNFGGAQTVVRERSHTLTAAFSSGFTALEQYVRGGRQGPWTDVYGASATLYWLLTGLVPAPAVDRRKQDEVLSPEQLAPSLSRHVALAVTRGLALETSDRLRSVSELLALLDGRPMAPLGAAARPDAAPARRRGGALVPAAVALAGIGLALLGWRASGARTPPTPVEDARMQSVSSTPGRAAPPDDRRPAGEVWTDPATGIELAWITRGRFRMGSELYPDERPVHEVEIRSGFWLQRTEVTQGQWVRVMHTQPWKSGWGTEQESLRRDDCPVVHVTWMDAQAFVARLNATGGRGYRLPSEAEWEYAGRAGEDGEPGPAGALRDVAWFEENASMADEPWAHPVGTRRPNPWGLFDMQGNVWEWCQDWFHPSYDGAPADGSGWESPRGDEAVIRGGAFAASASNCRTANRASADPAIRSGTIGFRVARTAGPGP